MLTLKSTIAHYKISAKLGQGGMGEVYRAMDTKLGREVAIKVLPEALAGDAERLARFQREAELLASLNHSNIAAIHGLEESGGGLALVLELVEGDTLSDRLKKGPMAVEDALETCLGIAEALEAAHEKGIIHRDLKPANVKFTADGKVKVLDFGLAKALGAESDSMTSIGSLTDSPTITADYTKPGTILGTAAYMSPEQARGKGLDKRTDIWSFGCVLFECLTGKKPFQGEDVTETLASIIKEEPVWGLLPNNTPSPILLLLRKCLSKDRKRRLQDVGDARVDLGEAIEDPSSSMICLSEGALEERGRGNGKDWMRWAGGMLVGGIIASVIAWNLKPNLEAPVGEPLAVKRGEIPISGEAPLGRSGAVLAISRDGKRLVYNLRDGGAGLRVKDLESGEDDLLRGTGLDFGNEGNPFFSWDGKDVGMVLDGKLVRLPVTGGTPRTLVDGFNQTGFRGGSWGADGSIVFAEKVSPLKMISEEGGEVKEITELGEDYTHGFPQTLPDGEHVLFISVKPVDGKRVGRAEVLNLVTKERKELGVGECQDVRYVSSGHLLYTRDDEIFAIGWDLERQEVTGKGKRVLGGVRQNTWRSQYEVSEDGTLIYTALSDSKNRSLVWVEGAEEGTVNVERFTQRSGEWDSFALSPDEKKVAIEEGGDLYIIEQVNEGFDQLRLFVAGAGAPLWSRDGEWLYYMTGDGKEIWKKKAGFMPGSGEMVYSGEEGFRVSSQSVSPEYLMISRQCGGGGVDILRVDLNGGFVEAEVMFGEPYVESWPQISPDGKWLAYYTQGLGSEICVAPIEGSGGVMMVSNGGGLRPRWSGSGDELYYQWGRSIYLTRVRDGNGQLMRTEPTEVIKHPFGIHNYQWTVSKEGDRFLMLVENAEINEVSKGEEGAVRKQANLKLVTNWFTELDKLVPLDGR